MEYFNIFDREQTNFYDDKSWKPFTESWKIYGEDMNRYERAKKMFEDTLTPQENSAWVKRY